MLARRLRLGVGQGRARLVGRLDGHEDRQVTAGVHLHLRRIHPQHVAVHRICVGPIVPQLQDLGINRLRRGIGLTLRLRWSIQSINP